jgi:hypothetical protein
MVGVLVSRGVPISVKDGRDSTEYPITVQCAARESDGEGNENVHSTHSL